jgi:hypothetical protein
LTDRASKKTIYTQWPFRPAYRTTYETDFIARSTLQEGKKVDYSGGEYLEELYFANKSAVTINLTNCEKKPTK